MLGLIIGTVGSGRAISRTGRYKRYPVAGMAIMTFGLFLLSRFDADTSRSVQSWCMAVVGLGIGLVMQVLVLATQNAVEAKDLGVATSASSFFRSMGGAFGVAIFGSIFNNRLDHYLADAGPQLSGVDPAVLQSGPDAAASAARGHAGGRCRRVLAGSACHVPGSDPGRRDRVRGRVVPQGTPAPRERPHWDGSHR